MRVNLCPQPQSDVRSEELFRCTAGCFIPIPAEATGRSPQRASPLGTWGSKPAVSPLFPHKLLDPLHSIDQIVARLAQPICVIDHVRRDENHHFRPCFGGGLRAEGPADEG